MNPIDPTQADLHLDDVAPILGLSAANIRQRNTRGQFLTPDPDRAPRLVWHAATFYNWAWAQGLIDFAEVPARHQRTAAISRPLGDGRYALREVQATPDAITLRYTGPTGDYPRVDVVYPAYPEYRVVPSANLTVVVGAEKGGDGYRVVVHQASATRRSGPQVDFLPDHGLTTADIASLLGVHLPWLPYELRHLRLRRNTATGLLVTEKNATPKSLHQYRRTGQLVRAILKSGVIDASSDLGTALLAEVAHDEWVADRDARYLLEGAEEFLTHPGSRRSNHHLYIPAELAAEVELDDRAEEYRRRLPELLRTEPVGDQPLTRALAMLFPAPFPRTMSSPASAEIERRFTATLEPVRPEDATLLHLALATDLGEVIEYYRQPSSGAAIAKGAQTLAYWVPEQYATAQKVAYFDFTTGLPFIVNVAGEVLPFPGHPQTGFSLGHDGRGPQEVAAAMRALLSLDKDTEVSSRWPFFRADYPTIVSGVMALDYFEL